MDMTREKMEILVVGAGPTGLTAALQLARRGYLPRIIDGKDRPTSLSRAVGISPNSLDLLEPTGVTELLLAKGLKVRQLCFHASGRQLCQLDFTQLGHRFDFLLSLPQRETERCMVAALERQGIHVEWGSELVAVDRDGARLLAAIRAPEGAITVSCDHLFGADGAHSTVRRQMRAEFEGKTHRRRWSIADAEIDGWPHEPLAAHVFLHRNGDAGFIIPIGPRRFRAVSNTPDALSRIPGGYTVDRLLQADSFELSVRQASTYQADGMALGGDAAHVHSPIGARGMNLGIEDASAFAARLADGELDGYTAERRPIGGEWITFSERLLALVETRNPLLAEFRNLALSAAGRAPPLQRAVLRRITGLRQ
ncbi:2-polyprenyl-6-methoxyphenol hydroxylase-like FAD-dependent oxidoreductase [Hoeflea marina]|uniref:2-polyprenyl-6-methoxyphenol hydroxylase-like FAD-dependent oxidoreductase n=1 Tax=Hoeflea marina TaxID=274592 RepID=A0A317PN17_9HYPH|nr:NAD(P)/FAD-dependent oxidoreductase [Hoeflea marina]PWW01448.1 2-polyprenyl-6-methoxyphenol hydroxylase-like FAD-dependent oxidoreductase [Hoeflea marina]